MQRITEENKGIDVSNLQAKKQLSGIIGVFNEEVSLFTAVAQQEHQCKPEVLYTEDQSSETMRFIAEVFVNKQLVARGAGPNKDTAKLEAHKHALIAICKNIYDQWLTKTTTSANPN